tara:strand:+ start:10895 stop:11212 length:318 start_codon:yes stop_codon:yes gene_type:complete
MDSSSSLLPDGVETYYRYHSLNNSPEISFQETPPGSPTLQRNDRVYSVNMDPESQDSTVIADERPSACFGVTVIGVVTAVSVFFIFLLVYVASHFGGISSTSENA